MLKPTQEWQTRCRENESLSRRSFPGIDQFEQGAMMPSKIDPRPQSYEIIPAEINATGFLDS